MAQLDTFCKSQHTVQWCLVVNLHMRIGIECVVRVAYILLIYNRIHVLETKGSNQVHTPPIHESTIGTLSTEKQKQNV